jgi:hypothetical protein
MDRISSGCVAVGIWLAGIGFASADDTNLAPGFSGLPKDAKVAIMPSDIEIFSISAGGVLEPRADWTESATRNFRSAVQKRKGALGLNIIEVSEREADELVELNGLHGAVARAIEMHHFGSGAMQLPTKAGKLDWSLGESTRAIKKATGADYAIFSWVRDSHASDERKAAMVAIAVLSLGRAIPGGGAQIAYSSLVELESGRVLWFGRLRRNSGNLKESEEDAGETLDTLFKTFPRAK